MHNDALDGMYPGFSPMSSISVSEPELICESLMKAAEERS